MENIDKDVKEIQAAADQLEVEYGEKTARLAAILNQSIVWGQKENLKGAAAEEYKDLTLGLIARVALAEGLDGNKLTECANKLMLAADKIISRQLSLASRFDTIFAAKKMQQKGES